MSSQKTPFYYFVKNVLVYAGNVVVGSTFCHKNSKKRCQLILSFENTWVFLESCPILLSCYPFPFCHQRPETYNDNWGMVVEKVSINNGNWTEWSAIWSEIMHVILKSDQNCKTRNSNTILLQPFLNRRIKSISIFIWSSSRFVEKRKHLKRLLHLIFYPNRNDAIESENGRRDLKQKWRDLEHKWRELEQILFTANLLKKCDSWKNHTAESQSNCGDHHWFQNGYNKNRKWSIISGFSLSRQLSF